MGREAELIEAARAGNYPQVCEIYLKEHFSSHASNHANFSSTNNVAQVERIQLGGSLNLTANCECLQVKPVNDSEVTTMGDGAEVPPSGVRGPVGEGGRMRRNPRKEENGRRRRRTGIECLILPSE